MTRKAALPPKFFSTSPKICHVLYEFCIVLQYKGEKGQLTIVIHFKYFKNNSSPFHLDLTISNIDKVQIYSKFRLECTPLTS